MIREADVDGDGQINYREYARASKRVRPLREETALTLNGLPTASLNAEEFVNMMMSKVSSRRARRRARLHRLRADIFSLSLYAPPPHPSTVNCPHALHTHTHDASWNREMEQIARLQCVGRRYAGREGGRQGRRLLYHHSRARQEDIISPASIKASPLFPSFLPPSLLPLRPFLFSCSKLAAPSSISLTPCDH